MFKRFLFLVVGVGLMLNGCAEKNPVKDDDQNDSTGVPMCSLKAVARLAIQGSDLFVLDRSTVNAGVVVYDAVTDAWKKGPLAVGLPPQEIAAAGDAYVYTTDYANGYITKIAQTAYTVTTNVRTTVGDANVMNYGGYLYLLERGTSNKIIKLDPTSIGTAAGELATGASSNPYEIAFFNSTKAYVTLRGATSLVVFNPATMAQTGSVDLSAYVAYAGTGIAESVPYMAWAVIDSTFLYVACQRLTGAWQSPGDTSLIVVINTATDAVVQTIKLQYRNPNRMCLYNHKLYVACLENWSTQDGGLEVINTWTNTSEGVILTEQNLGGDMADVVVYSATKGYIIKAGAWPDNYLVRFNPTTGQLLN
jgi:hypothetical protein